MFPEEFYYFQEGNAVYYSATDGVLDAKRASKGQPMFKRYGAYEAKPRTLIYDFQVDTLNIEKHRINEYLQNLMDNRFEIYIRVGEQFLLLTTDNLDFYLGDQFSKHAPPPMSSEKILENASNILKKHAGKLLVLDSHWINKLILHPDSRPNALRLSDLSMTDRANLITLEQPLIIIDSISEKAYEDYLSLKGKGFSNFVVEIEKISWGGAPFALESFIRKLKHLPNAESTFNYDYNWKEYASNPLGLFKSKKNIRYSSIHYFFSEKKVEEFLSQTSLQEFLLSEKQLAFFLKLTHFCVPTIEDLHIFGNDDPINLGSVANIFPNITILSIGNLITNSQPNCLPCLTLIRFKGTPSFSTLDALAEAAPNLSELDLNLGSQKDFDKLISCLNRFKNLKKVHIRTDSVTGIEIDLVPLMKQLASVKKFILTAPNAEGHWVFPDDYSTMYMGLSKYEREPGYYKPLLEKSTPKELLIFSDLTSPREDKVFHEISMPQLEKVYCTAISSSVAEHLFLAAPNLRNKGEIEKLVEKAKEQESNDHYEREEWDLNHAELESEDNQHYKQEQAEFSLVKAGSKDHQHLKELKVDADTIKDPNKKFNIKRIFYSTDANKKHPDPHLYRISTFNQCQLNPNPCNISEAFELNNVGPPDLTPYEAKALNQHVFASIPELKKTSTQEVFYGKQELRISSEWSPLASSSPEEILHCYHMDPPVAVEFAYSKRDRMYYLRAPSAIKPIDVTIDFAVSIPPPVPVNALPRDIKNKITGLKLYGDGKLKLKTKTPCGADYLEAIIEQEKGACRHVGVVFKKWMEEQHPEIPVRILSNKCHAFAEVFFNNRWVTCNLGGYTAQLIIAEEHAPTGIDSKPKLTPESDVVAEAKDEGEVKSNPFRGYFKDKPLAQYQSVLTYFLHLMSVKKSLVLCSEDKEILALNLALRQFCKSTGRPSYYIHSAEDISCHHPYIQRNKDNTGTLKAGPGGELSDFLDEAETIHSVLQVNYKNFQDDELVSCNSLVDKNPLADDKPVPPKTVTLGFINGKKVDMSTRKDTTSRFDSCERLPLPKALIEEILADYALDKAEVFKEPFLVPLYHGGDWREVLEGSFKLIEGGFLFQEGLLKKALQTGRPIVFNNPPINDEAFDFFYGCLKQDYPWSHFTKAEGYDWEELRKQLLIESNPNGMPLNPTHFNELFEEYYYNKTKKSYVTLPGKLEEFKGKELNLYLTRDLDVDSWAKLLARSKEYQIKLLVSLAPGVNLPQELGLSPPNVLPTRKPFQSGEPFSTQVIESTEPDTTLQQILSKGIWHHLDVTECTSEDLLMQVTIDKRALQKKKPELLINQTPGLLLNALKKGKNVVLTGNPSQELIDLLSTFILERNRTDANGVEGRLVILSQLDEQSNLSSFSSFPNLHVHKVKASEQAEILGCDPKSLNEDPLIPLSRLQAERIRPDGFKGFNKLPLSILAPLDHYTSEALANEVTLKRQALIDDALKNYPYAFVAGLSGIGKSTFIEQDLQGYNPKDKLESWALSKEEHPLLIIDEANLAKRDWTELEGLFDKPPRVRIGGKLITLSPEHRVLFIGNPLSYSNDRELATLFKRHGGAVIFDLLPLAFIYERIMRPLVENPKFTTLPTPEFSQPFLEVYRFLCQISTNDVLITARELEMMVLLTRNYCELNKITDPKQILTVSRHYIYQIANTLVPECNQTEFEERFRPKKNIAPIAIPLLKDFTLTASRIKPATTLQECLNLRDAKQKAQNKKLKYGGISGLILEGEPGIGKSELAFAMLLANRFQKVTMHSTTIPEKPFYHLPAKWSFEDKQALLLKAFHEGAVVVIDEINASGSLEQVLNSLMAGKDLDNQKPKRPGFFVIGTQNPSTMAGRREHSIAFLRRFLLLELPNYKTEEMISILEEKYKGLEEEDWHDTIIQIVEAFQEEVSFAKKHNPEGLPSFRQAERLVEKLAKERQVKKEELAVNDSPVKIHLPHSSNEHIFYPIQKNSLLTQEILDLINSKEKTCPWIKALNSLIEKINTDLPPFMAVIEVLREYGSDDLFQCEPTLNLLDKLSNYQLKSLIELAKNQSINNLADSLEVACSINLSNKF